MKILRNKSTNPIFNEFNKISGQLQTKKNEQKHLKKRLQKVQNDCIQTKQEAYQYEEIIERKKQDL